MQILLQYYVHALRIYFVHTLPGLFLYSFVKGKCLNEVKALKIVSLTSLTNNLIVSRLKLR